MDVKTKRRDYMQTSFSHHRKEWGVILGFSIVLFILWFLPTGFEKQIYLNAEGVKAKIIEVNNGGLYLTGMIRQGEQRCLIEILDGTYQGKVVEGINLLTGKLEVDKLFEVNDVAWTLLEMNEEHEIIFANLIDYYRLDKQLMLIGLFVILMVICSGYTGIRTLLSFTFSLLSIYKILIPTLLKGFSPLIIALVVGNILSLVTLLLVAGPGKRAWTAMLSYFICSFLTCFLAVRFSELFKMNGAVMEFSEALLYVGYENLNLTSIFQAGIYLACSGAILDLAIDISAGLDEVKKVSPFLTRMNLIKSGFSIGKSVVGTQLTTLLLAYMGSYLTILMVYMAQGTPMMSVLNSQKISAEILHTFVGCIGLVLVSPLTSIICGFIYCTSKNTKPIKKAQ